MQNQKTDNIDPIKDLPDIQENHLLFARLIAEGKSKSDAYRIAVSNETTAASLWALSSKLAADIKVRLWIDAFKREVFNSQAYTAEKHVQELYEAVQLCKANGNMGALVNALKAIGQVAGHYVERTENINETRRQDLKERMGLLTSNKEEKGEALH
jgi:hypothetical protein